MPSSDDFYRRDRQRQRQRQRDPLSADREVSIAGHSGWQARDNDVPAAAAPALGLPRRRNSMHIPNAILRERRPSMPSRSFTDRPQDLPAQVPPLPAPLQQPDGDCDGLDPPTFATLDKSSGTKRMKKTSDPRRRPDRNLPSIQPTATFPSAVPSRLTTDPLRRADTSASASALSSPAPSDDLDMPDVLDAVPGGHLDAVTQALIQLVTHGTNAAIYNLLKSEVKEDLEEVTKEHQRARDFIKSYPPLLEQIESKNKATHQRYKAVKAKLTQSSHSRDSMAAELANNLLPCRDDASTWRTEFHSWSRRLVELEQNCALLAPANIEPHTLLTLESRIHDLESNPASDQAKLIHSEVKKLWESDHKTSELLQSNINNVSDRFTTMYNDLNLYQSKTSNAMDLLRREVNDYRSEVRNYAKSYRDLTQAVKDASTKISSLCQEKDDLWTAHNALRDQVVTNSELDALRRELKSSQDDSVSKADFNRMCKALKERQDAPPGTGGLPAQHQAPDEADPAVIQTQSELETTRHRIALLENQVATLSANMIPEMKLNDYVKRYQLDNADLTSRLAVVEQTQIGFKTEISQTMNAHATDLGQKFQASISQVDALEFRVSAQQTVTTAMERQLEKFATARELPSALPNRAETELRSTTVTHTQKLEQLATQMNHVANQLQGLPTGGLSRAWMEATDRHIQTLQKTVTPLADDVMNMRQLVHANDHSIRALTSRYNNLTSEQFSTRMANYLNPLVVALQAEQNDIKVALEPLQSQQLEVTKSLGWIQDTLSEHSVHIAAEKASRDDFEAKLKSEYYDVLEERTQTTGKKIEDQIAKLSEEGNTLRAKSEAIETRVGELESKGEISSRELERQSLLERFQEPITRISSQPPELQIRGTTERPEYYKSQQPTKQASPQTSELNIRGMSQGNPLRPLTDRVEYPKNWSNGTRRSYSEIGDTITARAPTSPRKKPRAGK